MESQQSDRVPATTFKAWAWIPPRGRMRLRGIHNATLKIDAYGFTVAASRVERFVDDWTEFQFFGRAVIIQVVRPLGGTGLLFETPEGLARCAVLVTGAELRAALASAGLEVIETERWGWEAPRPVSVEKLGGFRGDFSDCFVA